MTQEQKQPEKIKSFSALIITTLLAFSGWSFHAAYNKYENIQALKPGSEHHTTVRELFAKNCQFLESSKNCIDNSIAAKARMEKNLLPLFFVLGSLGLLRAGEEIKKLKSQNNPSSTPILKL